MPHAHNAWKVDRAFISVNTLLNRKSDFRANDWIMDSGAFSQIAAHGDFVLSVEDYAKHIGRWSCCGNMLAAVSQDFMCEPVMLEKTGMTIADHQRLTIERYVALRELVDGVLVIPVLQGYSVSDYVSHVGQYEDLLEQGAWVGVGSVCKRNGDPGAIAAILNAIKTVRPDLNLHGFGLKKTSLACSRVRDMLYSADSMAWSFNARNRGLSSNDPKYAIAFEHEISGQNVQLNFCV